MPELPEVETVCRGIAEIKDRTISFAKNYRPNLRIPFPEDLSEILTGATVIQIRRRAKFILIDLDNEMTMIIHLGMSGKITLHHTSPYPTPNKHDHFIMHFGDNLALYYYDPRRFGFVTICPTDALDQHQFLKKLGPEPFANDFNGPMLYDALKQKSTNIKQALLDQHIVAGLGNIYVCEVLYQTKISPKKNSNKITKKQAEALVVAIRDVLNKAIEAGGSTLKDYAKADGDLGYFQHQFLVYGQEDNDCPAPHCSDKISRITQSGRSSFYCPSCQK